MNRYTKIILISGLSIFAGLHCSLQQMEERWEPPTWSSEGGARTTHLRILFQGTPCLRNNLAIPQGQEYVARYNEFKNIRPDSIKCYEYGTTDWYPMELLIAYPASLTKKYRSDSQAYILKLISHATLHHSQSTDQSYYYRPIYDPRDFQNSIQPEEATLDLMVDDFVQIDVYPPVISYATLFTFPRISLNYFKIDALLHTVDGTEKRISFFSPTIKRYDSWIFAFWGSYLSDPDRVFLEDTLSSAFYVSQKRFPPVPNER